MSEYTFILRGKLKFAFAALLAIGFLAFSGPDDGAAALVHFHHHHRGPVLRISEDFHEHEGDVGHEIHRIVVYDDIPRNVEHRVCICLLDDDRFWHGWLP